MFGMRAYWPALLAYHYLVLNPEWRATPRYLLPAVVLPSQQSVLTPPLYQDFSTAFGSRIVLTADDINETLRGHGKAFDCQLAPERGDTRWEKQCSPIRQSKHDMRILPLE